MTESADRIREQLSDDNPEALMFDDLDGALIGIARRCGQPSLACYSANGIIGLLCERGMSHEEAWEYFDFNIAGAWVGEHTPVILYEDLED